MRKIDDINYMLKEVIKLRKYSEWAKELGVPVSELRIVITHVEPEDVVDGYRNIYEKVRAQHVIEVINKSTPKEFPGIIRVGIMKLAIINLITQRLFEPIDAKDMSYVEEIENSAIKAQLMDATTWEGVSLDSRFEESSVSEEFVYAITSSKLQDLATLAKKISDKINLKGKIIEQPNVTDWEYHKEQCDMLKLDPYETTEKEVDKALRQRKLFEEYMNDKLTLGEYNNLVKEL